MNPDAERQGYNDNYDGYTLKDCPYTGIDAALWKDGWMEAETEKQMAHDEETYRRETGDMDYEIPRMESLNEAAEKSEGRYKETTGKDQYSRFADLDNINFQTFLRALAFEIGQQQGFDDKMLPALMEKISKKMRKDPNAYRELVTSNYADVAKQDETRKMKEVKPGNMVDKDNGMKEVKGQEKPKADSAPSTENRKGKPKGVEEMGITPKKAPGIKDVMDMPGKEKVIDQLKESIRKALKEDTHPKYGVGSTVKTPEGEGIVKEVMGGTLTVELKDGKQRDYQINIINKAEEKAKNESQFRPGVDLGASFEKFKNDINKEDEQAEIEKTLLLKLKTHDWYYQMSDDPRVWEAGQAENDEIRSLMNQLPRERAAELYRMYAPWEKNKSNMKQENKKDKYSKLREYLKKALKKEATRFNVKGKSEYVKDQDAAGFEQQLKKAGISGYTKDKV